MVALCCSSQYRPQGKYRDRKVQINLIEELIFNQQYEKEDQNQNCLDHSERNDHFYHAALDDRSGYPVITDK